MTGKKVYVKPVLENCGSISERTLELDDHRHRRPRMPRYPSGSCPCCNNQFDQSCQ